MGPKIFFWRSMVLRLHPIVGIQAAQSPQLRPPDPAIESGGKTKLGLSDDADVSVPARLFIQHTRRVSSVEPSSMITSSSSPNVCGKHALDGLAEPSCPVAHRYVRLVASLLPPRARTCCQHPRIDNILLERCPPRCILFIAVRYIWINVGEGMQEDISSSSVPA